MEAELKSLKSRYSSLSERLTGVGNKVKETNKEAGTNHIMYDNLLDDISEQSKKLDMVNDQLLTLMFNMLGDNMCDDEADQC